MADVKEDAEQMAGMIWWLAARLEEADPSTRAAIEVELAEEHYREGLEIARRIGRSGSRAWETP